MKLGEDVPCTHPPAGLSELTKNMPNSWGQSPSWTTSIMFMVFSLFQIIYRQRMLQASRKEGYENVDGGGEERSREISV